MESKQLTRQEKQKKLIKASLLKPINLMVLGVGIVAGAFSYILIPIGIMAYGILCFFDLSSDDFAKEVLQSGTETPAAPLPVVEEVRPLSQQQTAQQLENKELQDLQTKILGAHAKIQRLYDNADEFTRGMLGDLSQTDDLVKRSEEFLLKAQGIRNYIVSENVPQIRQDIDALQKKIQSIRDEFSKQQYQQALNARYKHMESLRDIQQVYERLVSQLTNISISLDSMYSRMMKLKTSEYSLASAESEQMSAQLNGILRDVEQLDTALKDNLRLPG